MLNPQLTLQEPGYLLGLPSEPGFRRPNWLVPLSTLGLRYSMHFGYPSTVEWLLPTLEFAVPWPQHQLTSSPLGGRSVRSLQPKAAACAVYTAGSALALAFLASAFFFKYSATPGVKLDRSSQLLQASSGPLAVDPTSGEFQSF